ncbi:MAG: PHP domain-containing protein [Solirubrobacterales bacterium]
MYKKGDFHIHTSYSDGKFTPEEVIKLSLKSSMDIIGITDHDTVSGISEGIKYGVENNIKVVPGVELSTTKNGESIHVLGYFSEESQISSEFKTYLKDMHLNRLRRSEEIISRLDKYFSIKLDKNKILENSKGTIARPHIAKAIQEAGYDYNWNYIFDCILSKSSPAYVPNKKLSTEEALDMLKMMGSLKILAHPVLIKNNDVLEILKLGFDGLEAIYHLNTEDDTNKYIELASKLNLVISSGSDFHGITNTDSSHSDKIGSVYLEENEIDIFINKLNEKRG